MISAEILLPFKHNPWRQFTITAHLNIKHSEVGKKRILRYRGIANVVVEILEVNKIHVMINRSEYIYIYILRCQKPLLSVPSLFTETADAYFIMIFACHDIYMENP